MAQTTQPNAEQAANWLGCEAAEILPPERFSLASLVSSRAKTFPPQKIVIYGTPGIGKTTFAATFPDPILIRFEDGAAALDIPTFPRVLKNLQELDEAIKALQGDHEFRTVIIDSLDWLEPIVWRHTCAKEGKENIEDFGYGKGYVKVDGVWQHIQSKLEKLRAKGMNVICIAHAVPVTVDLPDMDAYQRYSLKLHKRASALWMEWSDMILFVNYKANLAPGKDGGKTKAIGTGDRIIYTSERPAYQAKTRWPLDHEIYVGTDPTWSAFHANLKEATQGAYNND